MKPVIKQRLVVRLALILLPTLVAAVYFGLIASSQYVSEASFVIRDSDDRPAASGLAQLAAQSREFAAAQAVRDYLLSHQAADQAANRLPRSGLWGSAGSGEALFNHYRDKIAVVVGGASGVVTITVRAAAAARAAALAQTLLDLASAQTVALSGPAHLRLITLVPPNQPDIAVEPRRGRTIATVFGFNLIFAAMAWLVGAGLREHAAKDH